MSNRALASVVAVGILSCCLATAPAAAQAWPRLRTSADDAICGKMLEAATDAFASSRTRLYMTDSFADRLGLDVLIKPGPEADNIRGVYNLVEDSGAFERVPLTTGSDRYNLFWGRTLEFGKRFVLSEENFNWQGNWFELHAISPDVSPQELLSDIEMASANRRFPPLLDNEWRPPLIVRDKASAGVWAISVGHPADFLRDWRIFSIGEDGAQQRCAIQFAPDVAPPDLVGRAWDLLPGEVRELARLFDGALGSGENEGTANPTQRNRNEAGHGWANAAMRPWIFAGKDTSDTRATITDILTVWSSKTRSFAQHYDRIRAQYPRAEADLAAHYRTTFGMPESEATAAARAAIDIAAGCNFNLTSCRE